MRANFPVLQMLRLSAVTGLWAFPLLATAQPASEAAPAPTAAAPAATPGVTLAPDGATPAPDGVTPAPDGATRDPAPGAASPTPTPPAAHAPAPPASPAAATQAPGPRPQPLVAPPPPADRSDDDGRSRRHRRFHDDEDGEGMAQFLLGMGVVQLSSINDRLAAAGYDKLDNVATFIGGEFHGIGEHGAVFGGRGMAMVGPESPGPDDVRTSYNGGFGMFEFGYAPVHNDRMAFMLLGGIGGYGQSLDIEDGREVRFDDVLQAPRRYSSISEGGVLVGLTLALDGRVLIGQPEKGHRGFFTYGLRVTGLFGPPLGDWSLGDGSKVTGGPDAGLLSVHAALAVGFGGRPDGPPEFRSED